MPGFMGLGPKGGAVARNGRSLAGAALFATEQEARSYASKRCDAFAVVKVGLAPVAVGLPFGGVDDSAVREMCSKKERAELDAVSARDGGAGAGIEVQDGALKAKARRRL